MGMKCGFLKGMEEKYIMMSSTMYIIRLILLAFLKVWNKGMVIDGKCSRGEEQQTIHSFG
jgi:hypothetical protein